VRLSTLLSVFITLTVLATPVASARAPEEWAKRLDEYQKLLEKGAYETALPKLEMICEEIVNGPEPGSVETRDLLVRALTQRAVAEIGAQHTDNGLWYWAAAQNIDARSAQSDLSSFSEPSAFLRDHRLLRPLPQQCPPSANRPRPTVTKTVSLRYPEGARKLRVQGLSVVQVSVDERGRPNNPRVIAHLPAAMEFAALESMREWRFEAAKRDGVAVPSEYCASVLFRLK
jgi:TonB family protein